MPGIVYPGCCKPIFYSLRANMLLERLEQIFDCLANMALAHNPSTYLPLAYYLLKLEHSDEMVNLLALCCVSEIFKAVIVASGPISVENSEAFTFFMLSIVEIQALALNNYDAAYKWRYYLLKSYCDCHLFTLLPTEQNSFSDTVFHKFLNALFSIGTKSENIELFTPTLDCVKELCENTLPVVSPWTVIKLILGPLSIRNRIIDLMVKKAMNAFMQVHVNAFCEIFEKSILLNMNSTLFREGEEYNIAEQVISVTDNFDFIARLLQTISKGLANNYHRNHERLANMMAIALIRYNKRYGEKMQTDEELAQRMRNFVTIFTKTMVREDFATYSTILMTNGKNLLQSCPNDEHFRLKLCQIFHFVIKHEKNRDIGQQLISMFHVWVNDG